MYPPRQAWVRITSSPYSGDTYKLAETVTLNVFFNKAVRVIGTPSVELTIGTRKRQARYDSTIYSRVVFTYAVQAADADADGISIDANAIRLNGGAIKDVVATNTDAVLTHSAAAASTSQKVDGSLAPAVSRIRFHPSLLPSGGTYTKGDTMWLEVWFDQAVSVSGSPRLGLQIGSRTRQAGGELSATDAHRMLFSYRMQAGDVDTDGVSIGANALTLNGGSIVAAIDGTINAVLTHDAVAADATRKVGRPPPPPAPVDRQPFFTAAVAEQIYEVDAPVGGDGVLSYALTPAPPAGLTYTRPADTTTGGSIAGTPTAAQAETTSTLTATDEDGDTAALAFSIAINDFARLAPREGTTIYRVNGRRVTVTVRPGTPEDVEIVLPADLAEDVEVTLGPPAADVPLRSARFGFGPGSPPAVVDIMVFDVPDGGLKVCLPVNADLRAEADAADRPVRLLHYDGSGWESVANARDLGRKVCASGVTAFSPFAPDTRIRCRTSATRRSRPNAISSGRPSA